MKKADKLWIGLLAGLVGPLVGFLLLYVIMFNHLSLETFLLSFVSNGGVQAPVLSVSLIFNLLLFLGALKWDLLYAARGVLMATVIYAPVVVVVKYF